MADSKSKEGESTEEPPKKSPLKWIILGVVAVLGAGAGGVFLAPKFMAAPPPPAPVAVAQPAAAGPAVPEEPPITVQWPPFVVDVRDEQGGSRHIKMVVTLEASNEKHEEEVRAFGARGRQAVLKQIRAETFEDIVDSKKFEELQTTITKLVKESIGKDVEGKERVLNVLITDLVAQ